jgi:glycosyltransferase involved in cell wall biosynthesis
VKEPVQHSEWCVIIPTYNNDHTLDQVIRRVQNFTENVIVVNDGSTDRTREILSGFHPIDVVEIPENRGKGNALRKGFAYAITRGFRYAITIDSDGQHFAEDIPKFLEKAVEEPGSMIVGARNMSQEGVPGTSSFGHKFSIFWFKVETGLAIPDVQTGFRLYPLDQVNRFRRFYTRKYEFEVELLVRLAWRGVKINAVPIRVYYAPKEVRVSHFRKVRDFTRVSITNTILVMMALLWIRPIAFFRGLSGKSLKQFVKEYLISSNDSNARLAVSIALGLFIGVTPIWGWQILTAIGLSHLFKLNKFVTVTASNISLPPMLPFIIFFSYMAGGWILGSPSGNISFDASINFNWIKENILQYVVGSFFLGILLAAVFGPISFFFLQRLRKERKN